MGPSGAPPQPQIPAWVAGHYIPKAMGARPYRVQAQEEDRRGTRGGPKRVKPGALGFAKQEKATKLAPGAGALTLTDPGEGRGRQESPDRI